MIGQLEPLALSDLVLQTLDGLVLEFLNSAALHAHQMVVVVAPVQLKDGVATLEVVAHHQTGGFELGQNAIDRGQPDFFAFGEQLVEDLFRTQMARRIVAAAFENFQNFEAGEGDLEARVADVLAFQGDCSIQCVTRPYGV